MKNTKAFPFHLARRVTKEEVEEGRKAIENKLGVKRKLRGRPFKDPEEKLRLISIRLHPQILFWAQKEARKRKVGYQTIINQTLLDFSND